MPRYVDRVLKIENPQDVTRPVFFELIGHTDGGKSQIVVTERGSGTFTVHFMLKLRRLTGGEEQVPIPEELVEWLVIETCRRLARANSNVAQEASYAGESNQIGRDVLKRMAQVQRGKHDRFRTQRRMIRLGYSRSGPSIWGNNS